MSSSANIEKSPAKDVKDVDPQAAIVESTTKPNTRKRGRSSLNTSELTTRSKRSRPISSGDSVTSQGSRTRRSARISARTPGESDDESVTSQGSKLRRSTRKSVRKKAPKLDSLQEVLEGKKEEKFPSIPTEVTTVNALPKLSLQLPSESMKESKVPEQRAPTPTKTEIKNTAKSYIGNKRLQSLQTPAKLKPPKLPSPESMPVAVQAIKHAPVELEKPLPKEPTIVEPEKTKEIKEIIVPMEKEKDDSEFAAQLQNGVFNEISLTEKPLINNNDETVIEDDEERAFDTPMYRKTHFWILLLCFTYVTIFAVTGFPYVWQSITKVSDDTSADISSLNEKLDEPFVNKTEFPTEIEEQTCISGLCDDEEKEEEEKEDIEDSDLNAAESPSEVEDIQDINCVTGSCEEEEVGTIEIASDSIANATEIASEIVDETCVSESCEKEKVQDEFESNGSIINTTEPNSETEDDELLIKEQEELDGMILKKIGKLVERQKQIEQDKSNSAALKKVLENPVAKSVLLGPPDSLNMGSIDVSFELIDAHIQEQTEEIEVWEKKLEEAEIAMKDVENIGYETLENAVGKLIELASASPIPVITSIFDESTITIPGEECESVEKVKIEHENNEEASAYAEEVEKEYLSRSEFKDKKEYILDLAQSTTSDLITDPTLFASVRTWVEKVVHSAKQLYDLVDIQDMKMDEPMKQKDTGMARFMIEKQISEMLEIEAADGTGKRDFSSIEAGASVIRKGYRKTSPSLVDSLPIGNRMLAALKLRFYGHQAEAALRETFPKYALGQCWSFEEDKVSHRFEATAGKFGTLSVNLPHDVNVESIMIEHPSKEITESIGTAIRSFRVIGYSDDEASGYPWDLGSFTYDINGSSPDQEFKVATDVLGTDVPSLRSITLAVDSNWGEEYSCLYRFRVHGSM